MAPTTRLTSVRARSVHMCVSTTVLDLLANNGVRHIEARSKVPRGGTLAAGARPRGDVAAGTFAAPQRLCKLMLAPLKHNHKGA